MPKFFVNETQVNQETIVIKGQDVNHIKNVLRAKISDKIEICNSEKQENYLCEIMDITKEYIDCKIIENIEKIEEEKLKISIFQGLPKADKMELIIQKAVELGVHDIYPTQMKRCIVKLTQNDKIKKCQRWQKISEVAAKQCGRSIIPNINEVVTINEVCNLCKNYDIVLLAYEEEQENKLKDEIEALKKQNKENLKIAVIIGPEGGLEQEEVEVLKEKGAKVITLGKRILRTETASLNIVSVLTYELES